MGVFHMDYEVQYSLTTEYVDEMLSSNKDILDVYRCCVPFKVGSAASMYQRFWRPWDPCVRWVRRCLWNTWVRKHLILYSADVGLRVP